MSTTRAAEQIVFGWQCRHVRLCAHCVRSALGVLVLRAGRHFIWSDKRAQLYTRAATGARVRY